MRVKICIVIEQNQAVLKQPPLQSLIQIASLKLDTDDYGGGEDDYGAPLRLRRLQQSPRRPEMLRREGRWGPSPRPMREAVAGASSLSS
jgi:hypothetical protein